MKTLDIYITEICNLDCEYCYVEIKKNEYDGIQVQEFTQRINLLEYDIIKFYGGEPLIRWKDIRSIIEGVYKKNAQIQFSIITNGLLLSKDKLEFLKNHNGSIALSLHENSLRKTLLKESLQMFYAYREILGFIILFSYKKPQNGLDIFIFLVKLGFKKYSFTPLANIFWDEHSFIILQNVLNQAKEYIKIYPDISLSDTQHNYIKSLNDDIYCKKTQVDHKGTKRNCTRFHREKELDDNLFVSDIHGIFETHNQCSSCYNRWFCVCPIGWYLDNQKDARDDRHLAKTFHTLNEIMISFHRDIVTLQKKKNYMTQGIDEMRFNLTEQCNLRCNYCYLEFTDKKLDRKVGENIIDFYLEQPGENKIISFFGGEPILVFELLQSLTIYAKNKSIIFNKNLSFKIATNALLLTKEKIDFFKKYNFELHISINGTKEINDNTRDMSSKLLKSRLSLLHTLSFPKENLVALFVIFPHTLSFLQESIQYISLLGFQRIFFEIYLGDKWKWDQKSYQLLEKSLSDIVKSENLYDISFENLFINPGKVVLDISTNGEIQENSLEFFQSLVDFSPKKFFDTTLLKLR